MAKKTPEQNEATEAAETLKTSGPTKSEQLASLMTTLSSMPHGDFTSWFTKAIDLIGKEARNIPDGAAASNKASLNMKPSSASSETAAFGQPLPAVTVVKEDLDALFGDEKGLSEDFRAKAVILFEAAVNAKLAIATAEIEEKLEEQMQGEIEKLTEAVELMVDHAAKEWAEENKLAIVKSLQLDIAEDFMKGLQKLFSESFYSVPEEKVDVVEALTTKVESLQAELNDKTRKLLDAEKNNKTDEREKAFGEAAEGLAATDVEKLKTLVETVEFTTPDEFKGKVKVVREQHFKPGKTPASKLNLSEEVAVTVEVPAKEVGSGETVDEEVEVDPSVQRYFDSIRRTARTGEIFQGR